MTAGALAEHFGYNEKYFAAYFKQHAGLTPHSFITRLRIREAATLLLFGNTKVREVAYIVGFDDELYFSKAFKKHTGLSPRDYRTFYREGLALEEVLLL